MASKPDWSADTCCIANEYKPVCSDPQLMASRLVKARWAARRAPGTAAKDSTAAEAEPARSKNEILRCIQQQHNAFERSARSCVECYCHLQPHAAVDVQMAAMPATGGHSILIGWPPAANSGSRAVIITYFSQERRTNACCVHA